VVGGVVIYVCMIVVQGETMRPRATVAVELEKNSPIRAGSGVTNPVRAGSGVNNQ